MKRAVTFFYFFLFLFRSATVMAEVKTRVITPIPTNSYRSEDEEEYKQAVAQALEECLLKSETPADPKEEYTPPKIEIIYPPPRTSKTLIEENKGPQAGTPSSGKPVCIAKRPDVEIQVKKESNLSRKGGFEIVVNGKKYQTIREYKLDRIRDLLSESFFEANIHMENFTNEELLDVISSIRKNQEEKAKDSLSDMKKMMDIYNKRNEQDQALSVDLNKVKTIVIPSK